MQGNHAKTLDAKARQTQEQEQERWWAPTGEPPWLRGLAGCLDLFVRWH